MTEAAEFMSITLLLCGLFVFYFKHEFVERLLKLKYTVECIPRSSIRTWKCCVHRDRLIATV